MSSTASPWGLVAGTIGLQLGNCLAPKVSQKVFERSMLLFLVSLVAFKRKPRWFWVSTVVGHIFAKNSIDDFTLQIWWIELGDIFLNIWNHSGDLITFGVGFVGRPALWSLILDCIPLAYCMESTVECSPGRARALAALGATLLVLLLRLLTARRHVFQVLVGDPLGFSSFLFSVLHLQHFFRAKNDFWINFRAIFFPTPKNCFLFRIQSKMTGLNEYQDVGVQPDELRMAPLWKQLTKLFFKESYVFDMSQCSILDSIFCQSDVS